MFRQLFHSGAKLDGMRAFLYGLAALVIGLHNFYWLMNMVNGAPINLFNCTALLGSALLMVAAVLLTLRQHVAAKVGLAGSVLAWVYYAPSIAVAALSPFSTWHQIRFSLSYHDYVPVVGAIFGPVLLIISTVNSVILLKHRQLGSPTSA
jgi:hypothetical protein